MPGGPTAETKHSVFLSALGTHSPSPTVKKRVQKLDRLVLSARASRSDGKVIELGNLLCQDYDVFDPIPVALELLDSSLIPTDCSTIEAIAQVAHVLDVLTDLGVILFSMNTVPETPALSSYEERTYTLLLERWPTIVQWMVYLITWTPNIDLHEMGRGMTCVDFLRSTLGQRYNSPLKDEIFSQQRTVDLMLVMLCQRSEARNKYWNLQAEPTGQCLLADLVFRYCDSGAGGDALCSRLAAVSKSTRIPVVKSFVIRVEELVDEAEGKSVLGIASTVACHIYAAKCLARHPTTFCCFDEEDFLSEFARETRTLLEKVDSLCILSIGSDKLSGLWCAIGASAARLVQVAIWSPNPPANVLKILKAGLLTVIMRCGYEPQCNPKITALALESLLPYLYTGRIYMATTEWIVCMGKAWDDNPSLSGEALDLWRRLPETYAHAHLTYTKREDRSVRMCSNLKCPPNSNETNLRACAQCHSTVYCSAVCQAEDWESFHSGECTILAHKYRDAKVRRAWCGFGLKQDYARILDYIANYDLPPPPKARKAPSSLEAHRDDQRFHTPVLHCDKDAVIRTFNMLNPKRGKVVGIHYLETYLASSWGRFGEWTRRIQQLIYDMQEDPDVVLAEGFFRFSETQTACTFLKLRYFPEAPKHERYTIINSFWDA
ncbi:hypothetical protein NMY22_g16303 [Coprinellus aureogranulatus]|nr:hypothetical protein NMY22_g16303 [Coprinellus aureogranulatus]